LLGSGHQDATMDIAGWLRSLGLEQYEPAFRENHVDETVLPNLTAEDLKWPYMFTDNEFEPLIDERFAEIKQGFDRIRGREPRH
jgi:hypothetical protein